MHIQILAQHHVERFDNGGALGFLPFAPDLFERVRSLHRKGALREDRTLVEFGCYEVRRRACAADDVLPRLSIRGSAWDRRQE